LGSAIAHCISRAAPAERIADLPPAILGNIHDALTNDLTSNGYVSAKANFAACDSPDYPPAALSVNARGNTLLTLKISKTGKVLDGTVLRSAGQSPAHKLLDVTALLSLMQCKFEPAFWQGNAIEAWTEVEYKWWVN
jgi:TonB family protein